VEAIILAGGLGTRLRGTVPDLPKPMAPVCGRPFLAILLDQLVVAGFNAAILAVGYRYEAIWEYFGDIYKSLRLSYSVETEPLGTGGAIRLALMQTTTPQGFVVNGDTYLELNYRSMLAAHLRGNASITIAVRAVLEAGRYGALDIEQGCIHGFFEKGRCGPGIINAGVYLIAPDLFDRYTLPRAFSFENNLLMHKIQELLPLAFQTEGSFIDIGIPEDYARARKILKPGIHQCGP